MMRLLSIAGLLATVLVATFVWRQDPPRAAAEETGTSEEVSASLLSKSAVGLLAHAQPQQFLGARSCAAVSCHGRVNPSPRFALSRRNEYVYWLDHDPHARAYQTLEKPASIEIIKRLEIVDEQGQVTNQEAVLANCYGCHNPQPTAQSPTFFERDGVSCEICHGPAEKWIGPHVSAGWAASKASGAAGKLGFLDTKILSVRAQTCAQCHVGSPGREVNHDLIAAGHPVLKFELSAYHDMLPKHWRDSAQRQSNSKLELDLWAAGQIASAQSALELLARRAKDAAMAAPHAVWPEFAEYDCFACHHDLVHPSWWQQQSTQDRPPGMARWGDWYFSMLKRSGAANPDPLVAVMQAGFAANPADVQTAVAEIQFDKVALDQWLRGLNLAGEPAPANWDEATQLYLALVAIEQALRDNGRQPVLDVTEAIAKLRGQLAFPPGLDSPTGVFAPDNEKSVTEITKSLNELMERLQQRRDE